jgi:hypothetical protein
MGKMWESGELFPNHQYLHVLSITYNRQICGTKRDENSGVPKYTLVSAKSFIAKWQ